MLGHNKGPSMQAGHGFRKHAWGKARKSLLKTLPIEILRIRVARAKRLGMDYTTYASIRATTGHDVVAFLFSGNALHLADGQIDKDRASRLIQLDGTATRLAAIYAPSDPAQVLSNNPTLLDATTSAPAFTESWSTTRTRIRDTLRANNLPPDGTVLISATAIEREWCAAGKLAGMFSAEAFFLAGQR